MMVCQYCHKDLWLLPGEDDRHGCADERFALDKAMLGQEVHGLAGGALLRVHCANKRDAGQISMIMHRLHPWTRFEVTWLVFGR